MQAVAAIETNLKKALAGSRKVRVTFARNAIGYLAFLVGLHRSRTLMIAEGDYSVVLAVLESRDWDGDENRTIAITLNASFDEVTFLGRLNKGAIERLEAV